MAEQELQFFRFRPHEASDRDYDDLIDLIHARYRESSPDEALPARSAIRQHIATVDDNKFKRVFVYLVRETNAGAIGWLDFSLSHPDPPGYETRKHSTRIQVYLREEWRGQGIGKEMLRFLIDRCQEASISRLETSSGFEAGQRFADHVGAHISLIEIDVHADLKRIDWQMVEHWVCEGEERNPDTEIIYFKGLYSEDEDELSRYAKLETAIRSDIPIGDLETYDLLITADTLREEKAVEAKRGIVSETMVAVEADGRFSGFTSIKYDGAFPYKITQHLTGVLSSERGRGLSKWLKAKMLLHIRENYPQVDSIYTTTAIGNDPMKSVNERLHFKELCRVKFYSLDVSRALEYLEAGSHKTG